MSEETDFQNTWWYNMSRHYLFLLQIFRVNPRYILFIHLVINDMIQLSMTGLLHVIWYIFARINVSFCCLLLVISIFTTLNTPLNLACMAVECYVAVCFPMRYLQICTVKRTYILIGLIWGASAISILPDVFLLFIMEPPSFFHNRVFCIRDRVFRRGIQRRNTSHIICLVFVWLTLFFTYFNVLFVAKAANADVKKARNTSVAWLPAPALHDGAHVSGGPTVPFPPVYLSNCLRLIHLNSDHATVPKPHHLWSKR